MLASQDVHVLGDATIQQASIAKLKVKSATMEKMVVNGEVHVAKALYVGKHKFTADTLELIQQLKQEVQDLKAALLAK